MLVRWEKEDLTETIKKLLPAYIELASIDGEQRFISPNEENSSEFAEAISCILMTYFLRNNLCSLILIQEDKYLIYCYGFLITKEVFDKEIVLDYEVLPDEFFERYF